ncbi:UDP-glycosyltransferase 71K1-like isoform X1 [Abrus precatorius]|uniref:Glycosyltransferase n=1 Tax=Abrus precatorius TaxID=3816 RepID=A0A8B8JLD1_ABRPR|nr:UDP-glycosyltransferase 71K1-like isoform X1 [Abrus precatorius]
MGSTEMSKQAELIFIPSPGIGHLTSTLEFVQLLINRCNHLSVTILCIKFPLTPFSDSHIRSVLASKPQIKLIDLPQVEPPQFDITKSTEYYIWTFMENVKPHVKATLHSIVSSYSESNPVVGLVLDFFCLSMVDVGNELGIPSYMFLTSGVGFLSLALSLPKRQIEDVFNDSDPELLLPGFPDPVPPSVLPDACFNKDGGYFSYYKLAQRFRDTKGIIVNTFSEFEQCGVDALSDGETPPIYTVGPLIDLNPIPNPNLDKAQHDKILKWLDEQPPSSVVFVCFGSMGRFGPSQTREIALALQRSGVKFLWAMRAPPTTENAEKSLPEGFLEWMEGRGMLCGWAPQVEVLAHKAIGGFLSHCGWNSILESLWFGVPILTWPIYAEQQLNALMMREFGLAVELRVDYRIGRDFVKAEEIEKGLKQLMDRDNTVHKKVQEMKEMARKAVLKGGSSFISVEKLIDNMMVQELII